MKTMEMTNNAPKFSIDIKSKLKNLFASEEPTMRNKELKESGALLLKDIEVLDENTEVSGDELQKSESHSLSPYLSLKGSGEYPENSKTKVCARKTGMFNSVSLAKTNLEENIGGYGDSVLEQATQENVELKRCIDKVQAELLYLTKQNSNQLEKMKTDYSSKLEELTTLKDEKAKREQYLSSLEKDKEELSKCNQFASSKNNKDILKRQNETQNILDSEKQSLVVKIEEAGYSSSFLLPLLSETSLSLRHKLETINTQVDLTSKQRDQLPTLRNSLNDDFIDLEKLKAQELCLRSDTENLVRKINEEKIQISSLTNNLNRITSRSIHPQTEVFQGKESRRTLKQRKRQSEMYSDLHYQSCKSSSFFFKILSAFLILTISLAAASEFIY